MNWEWQSIVQHIILPSGIAASLTYIVLSFVIKGVRKQLDLLYHQNQELLSALFKEPRAMEGNKFVTQDELGIEIGLLEDRYTSSEEVKSIANSVVESHLFDGEGKLVFAREFDLISADEVKEIVENRSFKDEKGNFTLVKKDEVKDLVEREIMTNKSDRDQEIGMIVVSTLEAMADDRQSEIENISRVTIEAMEAEKVAAEEERVAEEERKAAQEAYKKSELASIGGMNMEDFQLLNEAGFKSLDLIIKAGENLKSLSGAAKKVGWNMDDFMDLIQAAEQTKEAKEPQKDTETEDEDPDEGSADNE